ncbi:hypothetical protein EON65_44305 [archaeon]|nr:MAG: hypothetical protein EON65_44305 [archaeon]
MAHAIEIIPFHAGTCIVYGALCMVRAWCMCLSLLKMICLMRLLRQDEGDAAHLLRLRRSRSGCACAHTRGHGRQG